MVICIRKSLLEKIQNSPEICIELNRNPNLFSLKFYKCASVISDIRELLFSCPFLSSPYVCVVFCIKIGIIF